MQIEIFALCDAATIAGGKLNILGSFDTIAARNFPVTHPLLSIACKARLDADEIDEGREIKIALHMLDPDLKDVFSPSIHALKLTDSDPLAVFSQSHVQIWQQIGLKLEKPGEYYFQLKIDEVEKARIP